MSNSNIAAIGGLSSQALAAYLASKLTSVRAATNEDIVFIARSDALAERTALALRAIVPSSLVIHLPAWDCLPYDRVPPSRETMGRRMDALRDWMQPGRSKGFLVTSLDVLLQRIPPPAVIANTLHRLTVRTPFDAEAFQRFIERTAYVVDGVVDEPGEVAMLQDVVDIFPAGATRPMRIYRNELGNITDLRFYDPETQRTETSLETMVFGPASELIRVADAAVETGDMTSTMERRLRNHYDALDTVFTVIGETAVYLDPDVDARVDSYLAIIEEAREAQKTDIKTDAGGGLYLTRDEWDKARNGLNSECIALEGVSDLPVFFGRPGAARAFNTFVDMHIQAGAKVVITGAAPRVERLTRRLRTLEAKAVVLSSWQDVPKVADGSVASAPFELGHGFIDQHNYIVVVTPNDVLGPAVERADISVVTLEEPELHLGDTIVHEDYGVGILRALETTLVDGIALDAARLEYHSETSVLVPIPEFEKLWRYGGAPDAIALDRLHTDAWFKKRDLVARDVRSAAQHLVEVAARRQDTKASVHRAAKSEIPILRVTISVHPDHRPRSGHRCLPRGDGLRHPDEQADLRRCRLWQDRNRAQGCGRCRI